MKASTTLGWLALGFAAWVAGTSNARAQGSLTPPGAPAPTMKTLSQVEPRTPITNAPCTISQPGSYYLTANLNSAGHGVVIAASGVTLDLMGFALTGDRGGSDYGVFVEGASNAPIRDVVVCNGFIRNFGNGLRAEYSLGGRFDHLAIATNSAEGVYLEGAYGRCDGNTLFACAVADSGAEGVFLHGAYGQCNGNTVAGGTISGNGGNGIVLDGSFGRCDGNTIADCRIRENTERGIILLQCDGNRVEGNFIADQTGFGTYGIFCNGTSKNIILRNICLGQVSNYSLTGNDTYGPIVTDTGALPTTGEAAHPWANFSR